MKSRVFDSEAFRFPTLRIGFGYFSGDFLFVFVNSFDFCGVFLSKADFDFDLLD